MYVEYTFKNFYSYNKSGYTSIQKFDGRSLSITVSFPILISFVNICIFLFHFYAYRLRELLSQPLVMLLVMLLLLLLPLLLGYQKQGLVQHQVRVFLLLLHVQLLYHSSRMYVQLVVPLFVMYYSLLLLSYIYYSVHQMV